MDLWIYKEFAPEAALLPLVEVWIEKPHLLVVLSKAYIQMA